MKKSNKLAVTAATITLITVLGLDLSLVASILSLMAAIMALKE